MLVLLLVRSAGQCAAQRVFALCAFHLVAGLS